MSDGDGGAARRRHRPAAVRSRRIRCGRSCDGRAAPRSPRRARCAASFRTRPAQRSGRLRASPRRCATAGSSSRRSSRSAPPGSNTGATASRHSHGASMSSTTRSTGVQSSGRLAAQRLDKIADSEPPCRRQVAEEPGHVRRRDGGKIGAPLEGIHGAGRRRPRAATSSSARPSPPPLR